jgi:hypothetical protein
MACRAVAPLVFLALLAGTSLGSFRLGRGCRLTRDVQGAECLAVAANAADGHHFLDGHHFVVAVDLLSRPGCERGSGGDGVPQG